MLHRYENFKVINLVLMENVSPDILSFNSDNEFYYLFRVTTKFFRQMLYHRLRSHTQSDSLHIFR